MFLLPYFIKATASSISVPLLPIRGFLWQRVIHGFLSDAPLVGGARTNSLVKYDRDFSVPHHPVAANGARCVIHKATSPPFSSDRLFS